MSQPHPTIPGVTVEMVVDRFNKEIEVRVLSLTDAPYHPVFIRAIPDPRFGSSIESLSLNIRPEHAETISAMIRDQAAWLAEQNGGAE